MPLRTQTLEEGIVVKSTGTWYNVRLADGHVVAARIRGKLRLSNLGTSNPVGVGDRVVLRRDQSDWIIDDIKPRQNCLIRQSAKNAATSLLIACNLDAAIVMASLTMPRTPLGFVDRFLTVATAYDVPVKVLMNKTDLYGETEQNELDQLRKIYEPIGFSLLAVSAKTGQGMDLLSEVLKDKTTLLAGQSGVGKSTLINRLIPHLHLKTGELSGFHKKGRHTTTYAEMFDLPFGGYIIDSPGMKEFGIGSMLKHEVCHYFPDLKNWLPHCRYHNCLHLNEPHCAVLQAVAAGKISPHRYESYRSIIGEISTDEPIYGKK